MASKYISGTYNAGYTLTGVYSTVTIGITGSIGGTGLLGGTNASYAIVNLGRVVASATGATGIRLQAGGTIANGGTSDTTALITGAYGGRSGGGGGGDGIGLSGGGSVDNAGTIEGGDGGRYAQGGVGIVLEGGGSITNSGMIAGGGGGGPASYGGIGGRGGAGVRLSGLGIIANRGLISGGLGGRSETIYLPFGLGGKGGSGVQLAGGESSANWGTVKGGDGGFGSADGGLGGDGIVLYSGGNTLSNWGTVAGGGGGVGGAMGGGGTGVKLAQGDSVGNWGQIAGGRGRAGRFGGPGGTGIVVTDGGSVGNWGTISGGLQRDSLGNGIVMSAGGIVTNGSTGDGTALITGGIGIQAYGAAGATVTNFGTISSVSGTSGTAITFGASSGNLLVLEHGYSVIGTITVAGPANTLELAGDAGSINVDFDKSGAGFTNFGIVEFGPAGGNDEILTISNTTALPGTISGFTQAHDIADLTQLNPVGASAMLNASDQLVVGNGSQTVMLQLDTGQDYTGIVWQTSPDAGGGTDVAPICFCRGTLILTDRGEVAVEKLAVGDRVWTLSGRFKPIRWIGFGRDLVTRANKLARPVIVRRGALADNVPRRDLYLTHGHALYFDGALIPAEHLVNHRSILWDDTARVVEYYHIELADHDLVLAEGAPAETYYDASNRARFQNTREGSEAGAAKPTCAPVLNSGEIVETAWARLFERAGRRIEENTTDDPDLHLLVDGARLDPVSKDDGVYCFAPDRPPAGTLTLCSRRCVPSLVGLGRHDHRQLGVAIKQIILHQAGVSTHFDYDAPQFREGGCHLPEDGYSWTDGEFELPARFFSLLNGAFTLVAHTAPHYDMRYPTSAPAAQAA